MSGSIKKLLIAVFLLMVIMVYIYKVEEQIRQVKAEISFYEEIVESEVSYLKSLQLSDGALSMYSLSKSKIVINPYFSNISIYAMAKTNMANEEVKHYIQWYLSRINDEKVDPFGIDGTIFDYRVTNLSKLDYKSTGDYDSIDSYAATFLMLISEYYNATGDVEFLLEHEEGIERIYGALMQMKRDDLFSSKPDRDVKYTMDNAEVYYGLKRYMELLEEVLMKYGSLSYGDRLADLKGEVTKIAENLINDVYDNERLYFNIGLDSKGRTLSFKTYRDFYPDMTAQIFPLIFEVNEPKSEQVVNGYQKYSEIYDATVGSAKENGDTSFYWTVQAYYYSKLGKSDKLKAYLVDYKNKLMDTHPYPLYNTEVAWIILACENEITKLENKLDDVDKFGLVRKILRK